MGMTRLWLALIGLALALCLPIVPAQAQASRVWVSGNGDDASPSCSRTAPCKTFAGSIAKVVAGGEIDCLDPGGFGFVTISKAITIDCSGTFGSVMVVGTGFTIAAGASDKVVLRGLSINGVGTGSIGIAFMSGAQLTVEKCMILGLTSHGINVTLGAAGKVYVTDTLITNVGGDGIKAATTAGTLQISIANTTIEAPAANGFEASGGAVVTTITNSVIATAGDSAVLGSGPSTQTNIDSSTLDNNNIAVNASVSGAILRVANNSLFNNGANFAIAAGGTIASNNTNRITASGGVPPNAVLSTQ
jgi:hypothetical protein